VQPIGMAFSLEGFAFFTDAIFIGIYLCGWKSVSPGIHLLAGAIVAVSGLASAMFVCLVNGWMNTPTGFRLVSGEFTDIKEMRCCSMHAPEILLALILMASLTLYVLFGGTDYGGGVWEMTVSEAAAAPPVLWALIGATAAGLLVLFPSIWYLQLFKPNDEHISLH
jgi:Cytochrome bd terminal oxidase subunit I